MTKPGDHISRRAALIKLGLGAAAVYCGPALTTLSAAQAASGSGGGSEGSSGSGSNSGSGGGSGSGSNSGSGGGSEPSAPSEPSGATEPSVSAPSAPTSFETVPETAPTGGGCSGPSGAERASISRRDMARANAAVARGDAKPLREIVSIVRDQYPGRLIRAGFNSKRGTSNYWLQIVSRAGSVQTVTVEAGSGQVTGVKGC